MQAKLQSGPAGLIAAYDLARWGYKVTVFEALPVAGGMLGIGIPSYRLPREVLEYEIGLVKDLGVEFKFNTTVGKDVTIDDLFQQGRRDGFGLRHERSRRLPNDRRGRLNLSRQL